MIKINLLLVFYKVYKIVNNYSRYLWWIYNRDKINQDKPKLSSKNNTAFEKFMLNCSLEPYD